MRQIAFVLYLGLGLLATILLYSHYEGLLEGAVAVAIVVAVIYGFLLHPRRDVFYLTRTTHLIEPSGKRARDRDVIAVKVVLTRLWLLFIPTLLSVGFVVISLARGSFGNYSWLNRIASTGFAWASFYMLHVMPYIVFALVLVWINERRAMRDAAAVSANTTLSSGRLISYTFVTEDKIDSDGECWYFARVPSALASIVFYNVRKPKVNRIATGFLFHKMEIIARGVTELDKQSHDAKLALAEIAPHTAAP